MVRLYVESIQLLVAAGASSPYSPADECRHLPARPVPDTKPAGELLHEPGSRGLRLCPPLQLSVRGHCRRHPLSQCQGHCETNTTDTNLNIKFNIL